jgi:transcription antitermination factor NusG
MNHHLKIWYAIHTRPRWEKKVARQLELKNIECYCPLNKVKRQWSDRKKIVLEPLFTSYVFVCISPEDHIKVKEIGGVINFVYWLKTPAVIRHEEIDAIKRFMNDYQSVHLEKSEVNLNDRVRIITGPLMEREGNILEVRHKTVKVSLPTLGYMLVAELERSNIERVQVAHRMMMA